MLAMHESSFVDVRPSTNTGIDEESKRNTILEDKMED